MVGARILVLETGVYAGTLGINLLRWRRIGSTNCMWSPILVSPWICWISATTSRPLYHFFCSSSVVLCKMWRSGYLSINLSSILSGCTGSTMRFYRKIFSCRDGRDSQWNILFLQEDRCLGSFRSWGRRTLVGRWSKSEERNFRHTEERQANWQGCGVACQDAICLSHQSRPCKAGMYFFDTLSHWQSSRRKNVDFWVSGMCSIRGIKSTKSLWFNTCCGFFLIFIKTAFATVALWVEFSLFIESGAIVSPLFVRTPF